MATIQQRADGGEIRLRLAQQSAQLMDLTLGGGNVLARALVAMRQPLTHAADDRSGATACLRIADDDDEIIRQTQPLDLGRRLGGAVDTVNAAQTAGVLVHLSAAG